MVNSRDDDDSRGGEGKWNADWPSVPVSGVRFLEGELERLFRGCGCKEQKGDNEWMGKDVGRLVQPSS